MQLSNYAVKSRTPEPDYKLTSELVDLLKEKFGIAIQEADSTDEKSRLKILFESILENI